MCICVVREGKEIQKILMFGVGWRNSLAGASIVGGGGGLTF